MAADFDLSPRRQLLALGQQRLMRFGLAVPALVAAVDLCFQKAQIGAEPVLECGFGHQGAVLLGTEQAVVSAQGKGLTGEFPVNVTVDESNAIVKVELGESSTDTDASFLNMVKTDANYLNQFVGKTAPVDEASIDVVAGATVSSKAVVAAVNAACASQGE